MLSELSTLTLLAQQFSWSLKNVQTQWPNKWHFWCNLQVSYLPITVCCLHSSQQASLCAYGVRAFCVAPHLQSCNSDDTSPSQLNCPGATPGSGNTVTTVSLSPAYCTLNHIPTMSTFTTWTINSALYEQPTEWLSYFSHNWSIWQTCIHLQIKVTGHSFHLNHIYSQWGTNKWSIQRDKDFTFLAICPRFYQPCQHSQNSNVGSSHFISSITHSNWMYTGILQQI